MVWVQRWTNRTVNRKIPETDPRAKNLWCHSWPRTWVEGRISSYRTWDEDKPIAKWQETEHTHWLQKRKSEWPKKTFEKMCIRKMSIKTTTKDHHVLHGLAAIRKCANSEDWPGWAATGTLICNGQEDASVEPPQRPRLHFLLRLNICVGMQDPARDGSPLPGTYPAWSNWSSHQGYSQQHC